LREREKEGKLDMYYCDESGFSLESSVPYAWQKKGEEILLPAEMNRSRINVFGLLSLKSGFQSYKTEERVNSEKWIQWIDNFSSKIKKETVLILDNSPIHKSKASRGKIEEWKTKGLFIYFLPTYSPELNLIEIVWRFIKYLWIPFSAYINFNSLKQALNEILNSIGTKYHISFV
jgi:transposase